ncbi:MAG: putative CRISPR-associated protein, partial [Crocosphaera sp.]
EVLKDFFSYSLNQENIQLYKLPGINYDSDESWSALEKMAEQLQTLLNQHQSQGNITLAATGGFKAQTMIMALVGNIFKVPVCYIHEAFKGLIYLPYLSPSGVANHKFPTASLPESGIDRNQVIKVQESKKHHRPKIWKKLEKILPTLPWVNYVRFDESAFTAPKNGIRKVPREKNVLWVHLYDSEKARMAISIDTTALTSEEQEQAAFELRERLGRLL